VNKPLIERQAIEGRLRRRYEELWADIRRELDKHGEQRYADLVQGAGDVEDDATASLLVDLNLAEIDRDVAELRAVQDAIARLRRGDYGVCHSCGQDIAPKRLEALPYATLCFDCQTRAERVSTPTSTPSL
jgi:RNA polymerase-binding protein DksA